VNSKAVALQGGLALVGWWQRILPGSVSPSCRRARYSSSTSPRTNCKRSASTTKMPRLGSSCGGTATTTAASSRFASRTGSACGQVDRACARGWQANPERVVRGSEAARTLYERFAPLRATRRAGRAGRGQAEGSGPGRHKEAHHRGDRSGPARLRHRVRTPRWN